MDACNADIYLCANHYLLLSVSAEQYVLSGFWSPHHNANA